MFTKINELLWTDEKVKTLSDDGKILFLYVLTCQHRNILGLYLLPVPYGAFDLGWDNERFSKGLDELLNKGFIKYDFKTNILLVDNFLKYNPLENPNQVKGAIKALASLPKNGLETELKKRLESLDKPFIKPLLKALDERLPKQEEVEVEEEVYIKQSCFDSEEPKPIDSENDELEAMEEELEPEIEKIKYDQDSPYYKAAFFLREKVLGINPNCKVPKANPKSLGKWADTIRLTVERDNRSIDELREIIKFIFADDFWCSVVQSPAGLRKNWDKIWAKKLQSEKSKTKASTASTSTGEKKFKTKFHLSESRFDDYTADELEKVILERQKRKREGG